MSQDATINDVLEAVQTLSTHMDSQLAEVRSDMDEKFAGVDKKFAETNAKVANLVTKNYLDDKLADLRGDLVVLTRKEDHKVRELIGILQKKNVLDAEEVQYLLEMEPFPALSL